MAYHRWKDMKVTRYFNFYLHTTRLTSSFSRCASSLVLVSPSCLSLSSFQSWRLPNKPERVHDLVQLPFSPWYCLLMFPFSLLHSYDCTYLLFLSYSCLWIRMHWTCSYRFNYILCWVVLSYTVYLWPLSYLIKKSIYEITKYWTSLQLRLGMPNRKCTKYLLNDELCSIWFGTMYECRLPSVGLVYKQKILYLVYAMSYTQMRHERGGYSTMRYKDSGK